MQSKISDNRVIQQFGQRFAPRTQHIVFMQLSRPITIIRNLNNVKIAGRPKRLSAVPISEILKLIHRIS